MALDYAAVTTFLALKHGDRSGVFLDRIALGRKNWVKSEILTPFLSGRRFIVESGQLLSAFLELEARLL